MSRVITRLTLLALLILTSVTGLWAQRVCLVGDAADVSSLPSAENKAYNWAINNYGSDAAYVQFSDITANGVPAGCRVIWFHYEDDPTLPTDAAGASNAIGTFVNNGGGLLTSGFATQYLVTAGITTVAPNEVINNDPAGPDAAWGIKPFAGFENHPVFAGIPPTTDWADPNWGGFRTISDSVAGREAIAWWTGNTFPGTGMGDHALVWRNRSPFYWRNFLWLRFGYDCYSPWL